MDTDSVDAYDEDIIKRFRSGLILLADRYQDEVAIHCQALLACDDALAAEFALRTFLELPKRLAGDTYEGRGLRYILHDIADKLCQAHQETAKFGAWITTSNLARLSFRERSITFLREVLDFSYKEIGQILGILPNSANQIYLRAQAKMQHPEAGKPEINQRRRARNQRRDITTNLSFLRGPD